MGGGIIMKNKRIISGMIGVLSFFVMYTSCENAIKDFELQKDEDFAYIKVCYENSRTIQPVIDIETFRYTLYGVREGDSDESITIVEDWLYNWLVNETFAIGIGDWTFTLIAKDTYMNNVFSVFSGVVKQKCEAGKTSNLEFVLTLNLEETTVLDGSMEISFDIPSRWIIKGIKAGLYDINTNNTVYGFSAESLMINKRDSDMYYAYYEKTSVPIGQYWFKADYYADPECTIYLTSYESIIEIVSGKTSEASIMVPAFGFPIDSYSYSITYEVNGGEFVDGYSPPDSYSCYNNLMKLPNRKNIIKDDYIFVGWYLESDFSGNEVESLATFSRKDITLYAKWKRGFVITPENVSFIDLSTEFGELLIVAEGNFQNKFSTLCSVIDNYTDEIILDMSEVTGIRKIPNEAFKSSSITNVNLPRTILGIGNSAFEECKDLIEIVIPEGCTSIGNKAFYNGENIDSVAVSIPYTITDIGTDAFKNTNVKYINYTGTIEQWCKRSWNSSTISSAYYLYIDEKELEGVEFGGNNGSISCGTDIVNFIGCDVTSINNYAFAGCISLKFVSICENVTKINSEAFKGCYNLNCAHISSETVGTSAFSECLNLNTIEIFESVKSIGVNAFYHCTYLTAAHFRDSDNWYSKQYPTSTEETQVNLSNDAEAANLLKGGRYFYKKE